MGVSRRAREIPPFIVMDVLERAQELERAGRSIVHLEVGEPDFDTPQCIKEAALRALERNQTHYTHSLGLIELRQAIAGHYRRRYGVEVDPGRVLVTCGTSPAMLLLFMALLEPGQEVIVSDPGYACYTNFIQFVGGRAVLVPVREEDGFQYRPEEIAARLGPRTKAILINSPANPTGQLLSPERMAAIAELAPGTNGPPYVVSDEIYHGLVYEGREHSILEFTDNAFVFNGFSKLYAMTGWRLGYLIAPARYLRTLQTLQQSFLISAPHFAQAAALEALKPGRVEQDLERMRAIYDERRRFMIRRVREIGLKVAVEPTGAFYVFANARRFTSSSYDFAFQILEEAGVGVTPGIDFGANGEGFIRFSYANSLENISTGLDRLERFFQRLE